MNQKDSLNNVKGRLMHFLGILPLFRRLWSARDWHSHIVDYNLHTSKRSRVISRCYYDAELPLTSLTGATQKKKHVAGLDYAL